MPLASYRLKIWAYKGVYFMNLTVIIFFIGLGVYLLGLVIYVLIKRQLNKKKFKKELVAKKNEEAQDHNINS